MVLKRGTPTIIRNVITLLLAASLAGCSLGNRAPATGAAGTPEAAPAEPGIPPAILTEVAATLYAPLQATLTQQALPPQAAMPVTPTSQPDQPRPTSEAAPPPATETSAPAAPTATQPAAPPPTQGQPYPPGGQPTAGAPTAAAPTSGAPAATSPVGGGEPTVIPGQGFPPPATYVPAFPPGGYTVQSGQPVGIGGVNLPACGGTFTANFLVINQSGSPFESLSIQLNDLTTGTALATSLVSDAPFMLDDRVCFPGGISRLESGYALFVGASTPAGRLSGHTLQANLLFCAQNGLGGRCFSKSVEFVVP